MARRRAERRGPERWSRNLEGFAVPIGSLQLDPEAKVHPPKSIRAIAASLQEFGQQFPMVVRDGVVKKGNGTLLAAGELGWERVLATETDLSSDAAEAFAFVDNRSAEFSAFEAEATSRIVDKIERARPNLARAMDIEGLRKKVLGKGAMKDRVTALDQAIQLRPAKEYVVIMAENEVEWEELKVALNLRPVKRGGYREGSPFQAIGTQRVIHAKDLLERMKT